MNRRGNSFARALKFAEVELEVALKQRTAAQAKLVELSTEIPRLQKIIASLSGKPIEPEARPIAEQGRTPDPTPASIPADLAAIVGPQDLSGMGSIPAKQLTEDELLPEPEGEALTEE